MHAAMLGVISALGGSEGEPTVVLYYLGIPMSQVSLLAVWSALGGRRILRHAVVTSFGLAVPLLSLSFAYGADLDIFVILAFVGLQWILVFTCCLVLRLRVAESPPPEVLKDPSETASVTTTRNERLSFKLGDLLLLITLVAFLSSLMRYVTPPADLPAIVERFWNFLPENLAWAVGNAMICVACKVILMQRKDVYWLLLIGVVPLVSAVQLAFLDGHTALVGAAPFASVNVSQFIVIVWTLALARVIGYTGSDR